MTKPSYEEPPCMDASYRIGYADGLKKNESELARVRGLLQRQWGLDELKKWAENLRESCHANYNGGHHEDDTHAAFHHGMDTVCNVLAGHEGKPGAIHRLATLPQSSSLVPQGAESAAIGKLDAVDKSGKVNRVEEPVVCKICGKKKMEPFPASGMFIMMANHYYCIGACEGSAETGGEKAAPHPDCPTCGAMLSCASCNWPHYTTDTNGMVIPLPTAPNFRRTSQNQAAASGVGGAHEGTTADKSGLLPTQLPKSDF